MKKITPLILIVVVIAMVLLWQQNSRMQSQLEDQSAQLKDLQEDVENLPTESETPDILILHQVNPIIMNHLEDAFKKYDLRFVNIADKMGNCGAASVGIALNEIKDEIINQKVMLCSFGTGGVITAGLWQFKIQ